MAWKSFILVYLNYIWFHPPWICYCCQIFWCCIYFKPHKTVLLSLFYTIHLHPDLPIDLPFHCLSILPVFLCIFLALMVLMFLEKALFNISSSISLLTGNSLLSAWKCLQLQFLRILPLDQSTVLTTVFSRTLYVLFYYLRVYILSGPALVCFFTGKRHFCYSCF